MSEVPTTRREKARAATAAEILDVARRVLVERGREGLTLRAIAREVGMTAPGLYRYYPSHHHLIVHVVAELYDELSVALGQARDSVSADDPLEKLIAVARRFRGWALEHPREFALVFGSPVPGAGPPDSAEPDGAEAGSALHVAQRAGHRFQAVFAELFAELCRRRPFRVPSDKAIDPALRRQLVEWRRRFPAPLPLGALLVFLTGWMRLYGAVCMEAFGHLKFALQDGEPMFEHELRAVTEMLSAAA